MRTISIEDASRLLLISMTHRDRPVDLVIARLGEPDGAAWIDEVLARIAGLADWSGSRAAPPPLTELRAAKSEAKAAMARATTRKAIAAATAAYLMSVGAAMSCHGCVISQRPAAELAEMLGELGAVAPDRWADMLRDASSRFAAEAGGTERRRG